jgi:TonB family protein
METAGSNDEEGRTAEADKKGIAIMDLQPAFGPPSPFGSWFADELSASLTRRERTVEVIDRLRVGKEAESQHFSTNDESDVKNAVALGRAIGANTVVVGSYGAAENGIGLSLATFRVSEHGIAGSTKFVIGMAYGKIPLTRETHGHLGVALDSLRPKDGIYRSGYGGVSVPTCIKCPAPSPHVPDVDVRGVLRAYPKGATVSLQFVVTPEGHARKITVLRPIGFGFDEQLAKVAADWEFRPATNADNKPVPVTYVFQFSFNFK